MQATITVNEIRPPKPGGKKYVIVDTAGDFYYIWPDKVANYQIGSAYDINFTQADFKGSPIRGIDSAVKSSAAPQTTAPRAAASTGQAAGGYNTYRETSQADKQSMFVTAMMKAAIQAQMVDIHNPAEMAQIGKNFLEAHRLIWNTPPAPQQQAPRPVPAPQGSQRTYGQDDQGDKIPFAPEWR